MGLFEETPLARRAKFQAIADKAVDIICGERAQTYGDARSSFEQIAEFWTAYIKRSNYQTTGKLEGRDIANMMELMKISRSAMENHEDSTVDKIGYALLGSDL